MNAENDSVFRLLNGRLIYMQKYEPRCWWYRHIAEIIAYCMFSMFIGVVIAFIIASLFLPVPPCPSPSEWVIK